MEYDSHQIDEASKKMFQHLLDNAKDLFPPDAMPADFSIDVMAATMGYLIRFHEDTYGPGESLNFFIKFVETFQIFREGIIYKDKPNLKLVD